MRRQRRRQAVVSVIWSVSARRALLLGECATAVIPDYQTLMLPLLKFTGDGKDHNLSEAIEALALQFRLTDDERKEMLPSGRNARFDNRVGWARTYLKKAGLLEQPERRKFRITERGAAAEHVILRYSTFQY